MIFLFFMLYFFIITVNVLLYKALYKLNLDRLVFNSAKTQLRTTVSCISDHWFIVKRNTRFLDLLYLVRDGNYLSCNIDPKSDDIVQSCGLNGKLNNRSEICSQAFMELIFSLR
jgi:hypothetical protein